MSLRKYILLLIVFFYNMPVKAQEKYAFTGKVLDKNTKTALPYASINIKGQAIGTITNEDGEYILKTEKQQITDTFQVSYLGYKSFLIPLSKLKTSDLVILLEASPVLSAEVIVRPRDPIMLLTIAVDKIPVNYSSEPCMLTAFYRETVKNKDEYIELSEAVLNIYKIPYHINKKKQEDLIKLLKGRRTEGAKKTETVGTVNVLGGPNNIVNKDRRQLKKDFLNKKKFKYYDYKYKGIVNYENGYVYQIDFDQKDSVSKALYKGSIYLDINDLAFIRLQFGLSPRGLEKAKPGLRSSALLKIVGLEFELLEDDYTIDFRKIEGKWFLHYVKGYEHFKFTKIKTGVADDIRLNNEILITALDTIKVKPFSEAETLKSKITLAKQIGKYDEEFWENYNYVKQSRALIEIEKQLKGDNK